jgi:dihydropteroate synthase
MPLSPLLPAGASRPLIMGIVNVTPDSFSDGGQHFAAGAGIDHALQLIDEGADILDIGGESTRPGAPAVSEAEELKRVLPLVRTLAKRGVPLSVDTFKPEVMRQALLEGATIINDIYALRQPGALEVVAGSQATVCLMHMQGEPRTMQQHPHYIDVVGEVMEFLRERMAACAVAGIDRSRIWVDPGFGFGKDLAHNLTLLRHLDAFQALGVPVLAGLSRKSMLGKITGREVGQRVYASVTAHVLSVQKGAGIVRVHDVAATRDALAILAAVEQ